MQWWGVPFLGYVALIEERPDLLLFNRTQDVLIEYLVLKDAPLYTAYFLNVHGMKIRYTSIIARRTERDGHGLIDLSAFNTDGFDIAGTNVHVHDVDIWNQDDCIAVKDNPGDRISANMTFERIKASGLGLAIGSIGAGSLVNNITFRDSLLYKSYKGIYLKFRNIPSTSSAVIQNILYENITIVEPEQWGIWIGPAQQAIRLVSIRID
jgi:polygalacturonase